MTNKPAWEANTNETDEFLARWKERSPQAYQEGQHRLAQRDWRRALLSSLARWREGRLLDQTQVAAHMGTSQSAVARLEGGLTDPKLSTLQRYANAIGYDLRVALTPRLEGLPTVRERWTEAVLRVTDEAHGVGYQTLPKAVHAQTVKLGSGDAEGEFLGVERLPGTVTISGRVFDAERLGDVIRMVQAHSAKDIISVDVDLVKSPEAKPT